VTEQQWNEFLDKLDFVQLADRWSLLPLHWLDDDFPDSASELSMDLISGLIEIRDSEEKDTTQRVKALSEEYRSRLASQSLSLDARLCPPGSRVTLHYLNPNKIGEGDCLITIGSWDRVGHMIAELARPGGQHVEAVGETALRQEPGALNFRHILLFPDKGTPSPRAFRALCEKTLRQGRGLGAKHFTLTHLHLPQTGLADRFAAAEVVSAVRQMLREAPGTTVDILAFSHRNFDDYKHWFTSLKELSQASAERSGYEGADSPTEDEDHLSDSSDVTETLKNLAKRSSEIASEATASVGRWFTGHRDDSQSRLAWRDFTFEERRKLARLYLGRSEPLESPVETEPPTEVNAVYLSFLERTVQVESQVPTDDALIAELIHQIRVYTGQLDPTFPLTRYFHLLEWRLCRLSGAAAQSDRESLMRHAERWEDQPLFRYLENSQEDSLDTKTKPRLAPVQPAGCRTQIERTSE
jgi:hypothetical protein